MGTDDLALVGTVDVVSDLGSRLDPALVGRTRTLEGVVADLDWGVASRGKIAVGKGVDG